MKRSLLSLLILSLLLLGLRPGAPAGAVQTLRGRAAQLRTAEATEVAALLAQRKAAPSTREALVLQQRIEQRKRQTELSLLRAQAQAARAAQDEPLAAAIDAQIQQAEAAWKLSAETPTTDHP